MKFSAIRGSSVKKGALLLSALALSVTLSAAEAGTDAGNKAPDKAPAPKTVLLVKGSSAVDAQKAKEMELQFGKLPSLKYSFAAGQDLPAKTPDAYWFQNPDKNIPDEAWEKVRENVKNGAAAFFAGYVHIPLDKYFQDPSFAVVRKSTLKTPLEQRKVTKTHPGKWLDTPNGFFAKAMKLCMTPGYYYQPADPDSWTVLAWMPESPENNNPGVPMLMIRPYGKGVVCVLGAYPNNFSYPMFTENILVNRDEFFRKKD